MYYLSSSSHLYVSLHLFVTVESLNKRYEVVPWFSQLVADLTVGRTDFHPRPVHLGQVVDKVLVGQFLFCQYK